MVTFQEAEKLALVIEALENYSVADAPLEKDMPQRMDEKMVGRATDWHYSDDEFWRKLFWSRNHENHGGWGREHEISYCLMTEWVARVPGLFWTPQAKDLRQLASKHIESVSQSWITYSPPGKSDKVAGGVGTLRFPPDTHGNHLVTLTCGLNASSGIPALLSPDVWDQVRTNEGIEGRLLHSVTGRWEKMGPGWAERFETIRGLPQGYLIVNQIKSSAISNTYGPVQFHPVSVMEYEAGSNKLFDFVYATADSGNRNWRRETELFFEKYRSERGRNGTYLTAADIGDPLWDAQYLSPLELRRNSQSGKPHLELLEARVRDRLLDQSCIEQSLKELGQVFDDPRELQTLSDEIGVPRTLWSANGSLADAAASFVAAIIKRPKKIEELIQRISVRKHAARGR